MLKHIQELRVIGSEYLGRSFARHAAGRPAVQGQTADHADIQIMKQPDRLQPFSDRGHLSGEHDAAAPCMQG